MKLIGGPKRANKVERNYEKPDQVNTIWRRIFSLLPFDEQVNCRLVCKDWLNLVTVLPKFTDKNILNLDYCLITMNDPPVTTLWNFKCRLQFKSMKVSANLKLTNFSLLTSFFAKITETVTYLDLSGAIYCEYNGVCSKDNFRFFVENLNLFKVLNHFKLRSVSEWLTIAYSTCPEQTVLKRILKVMLKSKVDTYEAAEQFFESEAMDKFKEDTFLNRYENLFLEKIKNNFSGLKTNSMETIKVIIGQVEEAIKEADKSLDISSRINTSVQTVTFGTNVTVELVEKMFSLVPNVKELNFPMIELDPDSMVVVRRYESKVTSVRLDPNFDLTDIKYRFRNLAHLGLGSLEPNAKFPAKMADEFYYNCYQMKSIHGFSSCLPRSHFDLITKLYLKYELIGKRQLNSLEKLVNLQSLTLCTDSYKNNLCFFSHDVLRLNNTKSLTVKMHHCHLCLQCVKTLLQSTPKLSELDLAGDLSHKYLTNVFMSFPPNLKIAKVANLYEPVHFRSLQYNEKFSEMRKLTTLILKNVQLFAGWSDLKKKLTQLKYLEIDTDDHHHISIDDILVIISSDMPLLQKVKVYNSEKEDSAWISTQIIERFGRKVIIDFQIVDDDDDFEESDSE